MQRTISISHFWIIALSRRVRQLCLSASAVALVLGCLGVADAQTTYSPTTYACSYYPTKGSNVTNPAGPETQSGGDATLFSNPSIYGVIYPSCTWSGFPSVTLSAPATLSVPFTYDYPGAGAAYIDVSVGAPSGIMFTSSYRGTELFTIPAGTNLSSLSVYVEVDGARGYAATGYVGWINVQ